MSSYKIRLLKLVHNKINDPHPKKEGGKVEWPLHIWKGKKSEDIPPQKSPCNMFYE